MKKTVLSCVSVLVTVITWTFPCNAQISLVTRHLTEKQKETLKRELTGVTGRKVDVRIVCPAGAVEACPYAAEFAQVFREVGWPLERGNVANGVTFARFTGNHQIGTFLLVSASENRVPPSTLKILSAMKATPPASSAQAKEKKAPALRWDPPQVDARLPTLSATPPCVLPDVLKQAGQRAEELIDHLENFIAHEQVRYEQTDSIFTLGSPPQPGVSLTAKFDYVVDFGEKSGPIQVHEARTPLPGTNNEQVGPILDKGLPALALIFYPALQSDYEMRCEGSTQWHNQLAWVVHFRQMKGKRPRTAAMETATKVYPLRIKGRAWIAADSGQVIHLETNLAETILEIDLQANSVSVDYAPVTFQSQNVEIWLPQFGVAYTDYGKRHMITEHTFSDFQLFSVQTRETIQKPTEP